jgi:hypothetical protein
VKSHQDDTIAVEDLPFSAQLNVLCDGMATEQMKRQNTHVTEASSSTALPSRSLPLEIFFGSQPISSHYIKNLRFEISAKRHRSYLQAKYKWSDQTWGYLAMESLILCARRTTLDNAVNRSKLIHNWLNLGTQRGKVDRQSPPTARHCPYCAQQEDFWHLLSCADPRARLAQYKATLKLRKAIEGSPAAPTILRAVQLWTNTPSDEVDIPHGDSPFAPDISCAVATQHRIGWTNFFRGFLSIKWGFICSLHDSTVSPADQRQRAVIYVAKVIRAIQDYSLALWHSRNAILHGNSPSSRAILEATVNQNIIQLYELQSTFSSVIRSYFSLPLEERLKRPYRTKQRWLQLARLASSHATSRGSKQRVISTYFPYAPTSPSYFPQVRPSSGTVLPAVPAILQQLHIPFRSKQTRRPTL